MDADPRKLPVPTNATMSQKAEILARDLAYGAEAGDWPNSFNVHNENVYVAANNYDDEVRRRVEEYHKLKWTYNAPPVTLLQSFNFLAVDFNNTYLLTEKAYSLLKQPYTPPSVFISYRRSESSAFALVVEARLKAAGNPNPFIDKNLTGGEKWHARLEKQVIECQYFICLIGPTTLDSPYVQNEIKWADKAGCLIIAVCHNGQTLDAAGAVMPLIGAGHGYEIKGDPKKASAHDYEAAANFILNACGYATYS